MITYQNNFRVAAAGLSALILALAGCAPAATPTIPPGEVVSTEDASFFYTDTPTPNVTSTPGPSPTATLPDVPPETCSGTFAYVLTINGQGELHVVDACDAIGLALPDNAGPALDIQVACQDGAQPPSLQWSPDGTRLMYSSTFQGPDHAEIHLYSLTTHSVAVLTPANAIVDAASGEMVRHGCGSAQDCHAGAIEGGQIGFASSGRPRWSPDGSQVLFETAAADGSTRQVVTGSDGRGFRALSDQDARALAEDWAGHMPFQHNPPTLHYQVSGQGVTVGCVAWHE